FQVFRTNTVPHGLISSNKLYGAGGNMLRLNIESDGKLLRAYRELATTYTGGEVWIMATVRSQYGTQDIENKMFGIQLTSDASDPGGNIFASFGKLKGDTANHNPPSPYYSDYLQIDTSTGANGRPGGTGRNWSSYVLKDSGHASNRNNDGCDGIYTLVAKYDIGTKTLRVKAYYVANAGDITSDPSTTGALAPNKAPPADGDFNCSVTLTSKKNLAGIILLGYGYNGTLDFDEIRVGDSWESIVGTTPKPPKPAEWFTAAVDGKEMVRLAWRTQGAGTVGGIEYDEPDEVVILDKSVDAEYTEAELGLKDNAVNETAGNAKVVYRGPVAATTTYNLEHVVKDGTTHRYMLFLKHSSTYSTGVEATYTPAGTAAVLEAYGETEYVNPFSYTNQTAAGTTWLGGHGFEDSGSASGYFYWTKGGDDRTWEAVKPSQVVVATSITDPADNYRTSAGNVLHANLAADGTEGWVERQLTGDPWYSGSGDTMYVAFRMAYAYGDNANRWAGLKLVSSDNETVFVGKAGGDHWYTLGISAKDSKSAGETTAWAGATDSKGYYESGTTHADRSYLVVAKIRKTSGDYAEVWANAYKPVG
ncbi:MAG: hypothetical protein J6Y19_02790, partial [Kiritimatiellae bacterium]|nr:hypothetical protein [Kiritimatiellia bacterium]